MTTQATHKHIDSFLKKHSFFGLSSSQVHCVQCPDAPPPAFAGEPLKALTLGPATLSRGSWGSGEVFSVLKKR